jgi:pyruvate/2-oxoglutarate dehydrogenase complex dihydrolipoamide acyltransferase (E2) component
MKRTTLLLLLLSVAALAVASAAQESTRAPAAPADADATPAPQPTAAASTPTAANLAVAIDAETGKLRPATAGEIEELLTEDLRKALSTKNEDLVEVESPLPGGGVMLDLKGRFQAVQLVTLDAEGNPHAHCQTGDHASGEVDGEDSATAGDER